MITLTPDTYTFLTDKTCVKNIGQKTRMGVGEQSALAAHPPPTPAPPPHTPSMALKPSVEKSSVLGNIISKWFLKKFPLMFKEQSNC